MTIRNHHDPRRIDSRIGHSSRRDIAALQLDSDNPTVLIIANIGYECGWNIECGQDCRGYRTVNSNGLLGGPNLGTVVGNRKQRHAPNFGQGKIRDTDDRAVGTCRHHAYQP
ncbi:hypothetical protein [Nocardia beijingensis]